MKRLLSALVVMSLAVTAVAYARTIPINLGQQNSATATKDAAWEDIYKDIIEPKCTGCHGDGERDDDVLNLGTTAEEAYAALVNHKSSTEGDCEGEILVVPGSPEDSLLLQKLGADPSCGKRMPRNKPPLSKDDIATIEAWIAGLEVQTQTTQQQQQQQP